MNELLSVVFRWLHIVAGILWIGLLYWFNFVNATFAGTMDGDTKKKVVPELMPRSLYFFRWAAMYTYVTGILLLGMVFYMGGLMFEQGVTWGTGAYVMLVVTFLAYGLYDALAKNLGKDIRVFAIVGFVLIGVIVYLMADWAQFSFRAYNIHMGALFGGIMAANVWSRIWPAQKKIITAIKGGSAPDAAEVALAGQRSRHNTYLSAPLVWMMINSHTTVAASEWIGLPAWTNILIVVALAWGVVALMYKKAAKVKGF
ncbi:MAG: urate hydroxylase PuuD [Ignavibacteriae bacterium]|nr:urate hydroxylase PuuD [Ignavibacteriota bacterium]